MDLEKIRKEMEWSLSGEGEKDILVVVKDGYEYVKNCLESVFKNTKDFRLHVWDNGSSEKTKSYLESLSGINLYRSETNEGFIIPNNRMVSGCTSDWVILLNSDTEVLPRWDEVMIGVLKNNPPIRQTGFGGGILDESCMLQARSKGGIIDYVFGYCFCMGRETIREVGLFDEENMEFAYCEDSDLSLRIRERGWEIYACHSEGLVRHYGGRTTSAVMSEDERLAVCAKGNQRYLRERWSRFIDLYGRRKMCYNHRPTQQERETHGKNQEV